MKNKTHYINRHDRKISHIFRSENKWFYSPICSPSLGIWKKPNLYSANLADTNEYQLCKRCERMAKAGGARVWRIR